MRPKKAPPEAFTARHELEKLAARLGGDGWKTKFDVEFTPIESLAFRRSHAAAERGDQVALQEQWDRIMLLGFSGTIECELREDDERKQYWRDGVLLGEVLKPLPVPDDWDLPDDDDFE